MLSSSSEYIKALREEKYLLFLEWTDFIAYKYSKELKLLDADTMANLLLFEWLSNGYSEEDSRKLALLFAVYDLDSKPLQGKLDYALKLISGALCVCMVFQQHDLQIKSVPITLHGINQLIKQNIDLLDPIVYQTSLAEMQSQFFKWVEGADRKEIEIAFQKINPITKPRYLLEDYILHLERMKINDDALYTSRISMAKRFLGYLYEQTELNIEVTEEIAHYANKIREMHPAEWEKVRLDTISPPSVLENTWHWVTELGMGFFSVVLQKRTLDEVISEVSRTQDIN